MRVWVLVAYLLAAWPALAQTPDAQTIVDVAGSAEKLGIVGILVAALLALGAVAGISLKILLGRLDAAHAALTAERKDREEERKAHAAELRAVNDKRVSDIERALDVMGTFNEGRKAIAMSLEQLSVAIERIAAAQDRIIERLIEMRAIREKAR